MTVIDCGDLTRSIIHLRCLVGVAAHMWFVEPDNRGAIFTLGDRWPKWAHRFATLPVGSDIESPSSPFQLKPTEHLRPPCSPSSGFANNSCSLQTVITILYSGLKSPCDADVNDFAHRKKMLLICFLMKARSPRNFPYIRCRMVLRKSLSLGSSLSNSSSSWKKIREKSHKSAPLKAIF